MLKRKSIALFLTVFAIICLFSGCKSEADKYDERISEIRDGLYGGTVAGFVVEGISGERESSYTVDGVPHSRKPFFIVTLTAVLPTEPSYRIEVNGEVCEGTMSKHPFNDSYSFSLEKAVTAETLTLVIKGVSEEEQSVTLTREKAPAVSHKQALSTAKAELKDPISAHQKDGVFDGEIYIRLIPDPVDGTEKRFWYVAFCTPSDDCFSVLIDSESGAVLARKIA